MVAGADSEVETFHAGGRNACAPREGGSSKHARPRARPPRQEWIWGSGLADVATVVRDAWLFRSICCNACLQDDTRMPLVLEWRWAAGGDGPPFRGPSSFVG